MLIINRFCVGPVIKSRLVGVIIKNPSVVGNLNAIHSINLLHYIVIVANLSNSLLIVLKCYDYNCMWCVNLESFDDRTIDLDQKGGVKLFYSKLYPLYLTNSDMFIYKWHFTLQVIVLITFFLLTLMCIVSLITSPTFTIENTSHITSVSRFQHLCKFIGTKESVCIRKEFNSQRIGLGSQHGRHFIVLGHQYGRREMMWTHAINY